jgi:hypothetical protein
MPGAYGTWHGTSPATGYRSSLLVVVASDLPQHFPFPLPLWDDPIVHRPFPPSSSPSCIKLIQSCLSQAVWQSQETPQRQHQRRGRPRRPQPAERPQTSQDLLRRRANERITQIRRTLQEQQLQQAQRPGRQRPLPPASALERGLNQDSQAKWEKQAQERYQPQQYKLATWATPWSVQAIDFYNGLSKPVATALFLLRTEVLGVQAWLAAVGVPGIIPRCDAAGHQNQLPISYSNVPVTTETPYALSCQQVGYLAAHQARKVHR